mmetsp:Transcript_3583/g.9028  ORF Transcript_3583/g.9028 Transcript_3583/m.9028 type:complete len:269 (+) Transcript_3583:266-1072(+)
MKVKRDKAVRRRMQMLKNAFGFAKPYKVICDGNFLKAALDVKMFIKEELPKVLQAPCNPVVSNCIRTELRKIGDEVSGASLIAKRFMCMRCQCEDKGARECILGLVGDRNEDHYVVASQDPKLRKRLREVPGVPLVYVSHGQIMLEPLSTATTEVAKALEMGKCLPDQGEKKVLEKKRKILELGEDVVAAQEAASARKTESEDWAEEAGEPQPKKRRKGPKGPNPLSQKKPQKSSPGAGVGKKRKRKHRRGKSKAGEIGGAVGGNSGD